MGQQLEIVKQVGAPGGLDAEFGVSHAGRGSHGIGHTRLSTESRVDLSHSQPFWAHGTPDLAIVHNGHITNYHRLRRIYEQRGRALLHRERLGDHRRLPCRPAGAGADAGRGARGLARDLDGSFSYLAATADAFGFAKDPFASSR